MKKGQVWSMDFAVSVVIFFTVLSLVFFSWNYTSSKNTESLMFNEMESKAITFSDSLIRTPGYPQNWNSSSVQIIGLAEEENILNETKIQEIMSMPYDSIRATMDIMNYNMHISIRYLNGSIINMWGMDLEKGEDPVLYPNSTLVVPIERFMLFDHKVAKLKFVLWI